MNTLQKSILKAAKENAYQIRSLIGDESYVKVLRQLEREEKEHRVWGRDFRGFHPHAPSVTNVALVDLSRLWIEYTTRDLHREHLHRTRLSHILVWSLCAGKNIELHSEDFDYCTFIHGKAEK